MPKATKAEKKAARTAERERSARAAGEAAKSKKRKKSQSETELPDIVEMEVTPPPPPSPGALETESQNNDPSTEEAGDFNGLLEQDDEDGDVEFIFGEAAVSYAGKRERELEPWVLEIAPKKPVAFYDNHMEPWGSMTEDRIRALITSNPHFIFGALSGRFSNERKIALLAASTQYLLKRDVQVLPLTKSTPWAMVVLNSVEEIELLEKQGAVINRNHKTLIVYRRLRKTPYKTRSITVLRVNTGKEDLVKQALLGLYRGCKVVTRRRGAESGQIMGDVVCLIKLLEGTSFEYPRQLRVEKDVQLESKHTPPCIICHSNDHYEFDCQWRAVDKDFNRYRVDYGEPRRSDNKVDNVQNLQNQ